MKKLLSIILIAISLNAGAQSGAFRNLQIYDNIHLKNRTIYNFSNDSVLTNADSISLVTSSAVYNYFKNRGAYSKAQTDSIALLKQNNITLTTTATSGVSTLTGTTLNIPNYSTGTGTVTSVATGYALSGGTITTTGTIIVDSAALALKFKRITDSINIITGYTTLYQNSKKLNSSDTSNKWMTNVRRIPGSTTVEKQIGGTWTTAFIDSVGSGGSSTSLQFLVPTLIDTTGSGLTAASTNTTNINSTIVSAKAAGKGVFIPKGYFAVNTITYDVTVPIVGAGQLYSQLISASAVPMIQNVASGATLYYRGQIRDIWFNGNATGTIGWDLTSVSNSTFERFVIQNFTTAGIKLTGCFINKFNEGYSGVNQTGILARKGTYSSVLNVFSRMVISANVRWAADLDQTEAFYFIDGCDFEQNGTNGNDSTGTILTTNASPIGMSNGVGVVIDNAWFEQDSGRAILRVEKPSNYTLNTISNTIIRGNGTKNMILATSNDAVLTSKVFIVGGNIGTTGDTCLNANGIGAYIAIQEAKINGISYTVNGGIINDYTSNATWDMQGNTTVSGTGTFLGTISNTPLHIRTNNVEKMIVDSLGNVGIGQLTPTARLDITTPANRAGLKILGSASQDKSLLLIQSSGGIDSVYVDKGNQILGIGGGNQTPTKAFSSFKGIFLNPNSGYVQMTVKNSSGVEGGIIAHTSGIVEIGAWSNHAVTFEQNQILKGAIATNGNITWGSATDQGSKIGLDGSMSMSIGLKSGSYTTTSSDHTILVTGTGLTITLPTAVGCQGREYVIKLTASGTGTVATTSSQTIDGSTTYSLSAQYKYVTVQSDNANWYIIANN